jgi:hypothetical protein
VKIKCPECGGDLAPRPNNQPMQCRACGWESAIVVPYVGPIMQEHVAEQFEALSRDIKSGAAFAGPEWRVAPVIEQPGDGFRAAILVGIDLTKRAWWASPFHYWGQAGLLWGGSVMPESWDKFFNDFDADPPKRDAGYIRAPFGGMIEAIVRRRRRCVGCGKWFWRQGWWNPLAGVNIFEEHCSKACADEDDPLPY